MRDGPFFLIHTFFVEQSRRMRQKGTGPLGPVPQPDLWDIVPQAGPRANKVCVGRGGARERVQFSPQGGNRTKRTLLRRGFGEAPQQAFSRGPRRRENGKCVHTCIACQTALPRKWAQKTEARAFPYASSISWACFIACIVASTTFNSFSSRALSMASIRFLHSLPLFLDG